MSSTFPILVYLLGLLQGAGYAYAIWGKPSAFREGWRKGCTFGMYRSSK